MASISDSSDISDVDPPGTDHATDDIQPAQQQQNTLTLLGLPREIRNIIYELLIDDIEVPLPLLEPNEGPGPGMFAACREEQTTDYIMDRPARHDNVLGTEIYGLRQLILSCSQIKQEIMEVYAARHHSDFVVPNFSSPQLFRWMKVMMHSAALFKLKAFQFDGKLECDTVATLFQICHLFQDANNEDAFKIKFRYNGGTPEPSPRPYLVVVPAHLTAVIYPLPRPISTAWQLQHRLDLLSWDVSHVVSNNITIQLKVRAAQLAGKAAKRVRKKARVWARATIARLSETPCDGCESCGNMD